jgi:predicted ATPase
LIRVKLKATWTTHSSLTAPDEYDLRIGRRAKRDGYSLSRHETFQFKRTKGRVRRITISGEKADVVGIGKDDGESPERSIGIRKLSSGLSTLPRLSDEEGGAEVTNIAGHLQSFRVFDVDVAAARRPIKRLRPERVTLDETAGNLAASLLSLQAYDPDAWQRLVEDAIEVLPQLKGIDFDFLSEPGPGIMIVLHESGLRRPTPLADASYGRSGSSGCWLSSTIQSRPR